MEGIKTYNVETVIVWIFYIFKDIFYIVFQGPSTTAFKDFQNCNREMFFFNHHQGHCRRI